MKKLLSILSAVMLVSSASLPVVGCSIGNRVDESIDPVLEQQNFNVLANVDFNLDEKKPALLFPEGSIKPEDFFYSNGFDGDNKFISDRSAGIEGSFGASKWTLVDMLNTKLNLDLKRSAKLKDIDKSKILTKGDAEKAVTFEVENLDKLKQITVDDITGTYQEGGDKPVDNDSKNSVEAFNNIVKLGNMDWKKQRDFLISPYFSDRTYTKKTTVSLGEKKFTFTQLIMISNTGLFYNHSTEKKPENAWIANEIKEMDKTYNELTGLTGDTDSLDGFTRDDFKNLVFSQMNIFTAQKQDYSVSVNLDCNNLRSQLINGLKNATVLVNEYINSHNQKLFADYIKDVIAKRNADKNPISLVNDSNNSLVIQKDENAKTTITFNKDSKGFNYPRLGMSLDVETVKDDEGNVSNVYRPKDSFINNVINYINSILNVSLSSKIDKAQLDISVTKNANPATPNILDKGDTIVIKNNDKYTGTSKLTITGEDDISDFDANNMLAEDPKIENLKFIYVPKKSPLLKNDWLYDSLKITSADELKTKASDYWIEKLNANGDIIPVQKESGPVGEIRNTLINANTLDSVLNLMIDKINKAVFSSSLNKDGLLTTNTKAYLTDADYSNPININFDINGTLN